MPADAERPALHWACDTELLHPRLKGGAFQRNLQGGDHKSLRGRKKRGLGNGLDVTCQESAPENRCIKKPPPRAPTSRIVRDVVHFDGVTLYNHHPCVHVSASALPVWMYMAGPAGEIDWLFTDQQHGYTRFYANVDTLVMGGRDRNCLEKYSPFSMRDLVSVAKWHHD
jgi:hypothetical protein